MDRLGQQGPLLSNDLQRNDIQLADLTPSLLGFPPFFVQRFVNKTDLLFIFLELVTPCNE
jgi:hypothetical protein